MSDLGGYVKDLLLFFWPPLLTCVAIGAIAAGKNRRMFGALLGLAGGLTLSLVLMLTGPPPGRP
jgi:hypothetical protein